MLHRYSELQERFRIADGYQLELKRRDGAARPRLRARGSSSKLTDHLSGGWQMRLALAKLLLGAPDLLLLDEPTNHLDLDARNWLEGYLADYPHSVILVSHDRYFLDAVVTRIADLALRTITDYHSQLLAVPRAARGADVSGCVKRRSARTRRSRASRSSSIGSATRRPRRRRSRAGSRCWRRSSASRCRPSASAFTFSSPRRRRAAASCFELKDVRKAYGPKVVLDKVNLHIERGDRIALVGHNGAGKSTLMRMLSAEEAPDRGERIEGHQVVMQYFAQDEADAARSHAHGLRNARRRDRLTR